MSGHAFAVRIGVGASPVWRSKQLRAMSVMGGSQGAGRVSSSLAIFILPWSRWKPRAISPPNAAGIDAGNSFFH